MSSSPPGTTLPIYIRPHFEINMVDPDGRFEIRWVGEEIAGKVSMVVIHDSFDFFPEEFYS